VIWELPFRDYDAVAQGRRTALVLARQPLRIHPGDRIRVVALGSPTVDAWTLVEVTDVQVCGDHQILSIRQVPDRLTCATPGGLIQAVAETGEDGPAGVTLTVDGQTAVTLTADAGALRVRVFPPRGAGVLWDALWQEEPPPMAE